MNMKKNKKMEDMMKKISLCLLVVLFLTTIAFADYSITRGPDIGEIYFIGPTATGEGIYHSTNFGETAVCVDSTLNTNIYFMSITADLTLGVLYGFSMPENLYISYNYGQQGSWIFRKSGIYIGCNSGVIEGEIYNAIVSHSENYGINFIQHTYNGFFGNLKGVEIDNQDGVGYATVNVTSIPDFIYLLITHDNFENLQIQKVLNYNQQNGFNISRGVQEGETFIIDSYFNLFYSTDYCQTWIKINEFNFSDFYKFGSVGGRQDGEYYMMLSFDNMMGQNRHIYIYHTTDYGRTFEVYHPFSKGEEPLVANFSSATTEGNAPLSVSFCNYSVGDIQSYEWDFNNDGVVDSYEAEPEYTYQDTENYSVKLTVYDTDGSDEFLRENYIHVKDPNAIDEEEEHPGILLNNTPNPFCSSTAINYSLQSNIREATIEIYNLKGQLVKTLPSFPNRGLGTSEVVWDGKDDKGKEVGAGMYFIYMKTGENVNVKKTVKLGL